MLLNDSVDDAERQRLLPFVTRLACADTRDIERLRSAYISARSRAHYSFDEGLKVLEGALAIGRQAEPLGAEAMVRMEDTQRTANRSTSVPDTLFFSKLKKWFVPGKQEEFS